MAPKRAILLRDDPSATDEFGPHKKIASIIKDEIARSSSGRSIAVVGPWGSGKSTVIQLLKGELSISKDVSAHVFVYDAWSHQGDPLRRAFLEDLINSLKINQLLSDEEIDVARQKYGIEPK